MRCFMKMKWLNQTGIINYLKKNTLWDNFSKKTKFQYKFNQSDWSNKFDEMHYKKTN